ncbi:MAG: hypothetical protein AAGA54_34910 [Myxococcota bacterium]
MRSASLSLVLSVGLVASCAEDELDLPPTELVYESDLTILRAEPGLPLCAETGPRMDDQTQFIADTLELGGPSAPFTFYWLTPDGLEGSPCSGGLGCAGGSTVYSTQVPISHEAVHAYLDERFGGERKRRNTFIEEGLAEVFSTETQHLGLPEGDVWELLMQPGRNLDNAARVRAGHFVRTMLDDYSRTEVANFYRGTVGVVSVEGVSAAFESAFGEELGAFVDRYEDVPLCEMRGGFELAMECGAGESTDVYDDDGRTLIERTLSCGEPGTFNFDAEHMATTFTIEIPDFQVGWGRIHHLEAVGNGVVAQLYGCEGCGQPFFFDSREGAFWEAIPPGRYWGRLLVPIDQPGSAGLRIVECAGENLC